MKRNCWEFKNCGRQEGGEHAASLGVCPVTTESRLHGIHEGKNAGRACWVVGGTLCRGEIQGSFAQKYKNCEICDFYRDVRKQESGRFVLSAVLLNRIRE